MSEQVKPPAADEVSSAAAARFESLLRITEAIVAHRSLAEPFRDLAAQPRPLVGFDYINVLLHDPARDVMRLHLTETPLADSLPVGHEVPVEGSGAGRVWQTQRPLLAHDIEAEERFPLCRRPLPPLRHQLGLLLPAHVRRTRPHEETRADVTQRHKGRGKG